MGGIVKAARAEYLRKLQPAAEAFYSGISDGNEKMEILPGWDCAEESEENCQKRLLEELREARSADLAAGFTTVGPHRDDFRIQINGLSARNFGSQGQQRSAVLALKLGEASVQESAIGEKPVVLLDDVMSELDAGRQTFLLNQMKEWQVFLTCCDPSSVMRMTKGIAVQMEHGVLLSQ